MFTYFTKEQFISFSTWVSGRHEFDEQKYQQWLSSNYNLWHDPMPPIFAEGEMVGFTTILGEPSKLTPARITAVHIYRNVAKYDIELHLQNGLKERLYNVTPTFLQRVDAEQINVHPEDLCQQCGGKNVVWSADNDLWNELMGSSSGIICPQCFEKVAEENAVSVIFRAGKQIELQKESNFVVRLKAHILKCWVKSGMLEVHGNLFPYDEADKAKKAFIDSLGDGAVDALKVEGCVQKYIPKQNKES